MTVHQLIPNPLILSPSRDIPFSKLVLSQSNIRRVKAGVSIGELAEDIFHRTLLQSLNVRAQLGEDGKETGLFEVPAGGRRFRALELLVKSKRMAPDQAVPCVIREGGIAEEDSLAENVHREQLHPLDQFRAFLELREKGVTEEEIAARFFVTPQIVKQRLKLASVSPNLLQVYADDGMTLDQLIAFAVSDDHGRQEQVWDAVNQAGAYRSPQTIRHMLTETSVAANDARALFIGADAYCEAGGTIMRDLFQGDNGGWFQDPALLDRLVNEKLATIASDIAAEGWLWVDASVDRGYGYAHGMRRIAGEKPALTKKQQKTLDKLTIQYDELIEGCESIDDLPEGGAEKLAELEAAMSAIQDRPVIYDKDEIGRSGVFIHLDHNGRVNIDRGHTRAEDEVPKDEGEDGNPAPANGAAPTVSVGGKPVEADDDGDVIKPLPERLVIELTARRTIALQNALAKDPETAFAAVLHAMALSAFYHGGSESCLELKLSGVGFRDQPTEFRECVAAVEVVERHEKWKMALPQSRCDLWGALHQLSGDEQASLLAHCASLSVNAMIEPVNRYNGSGSGNAKRISHADVLARATGLDMAANWTASVGTYFEKVTKPRILEAVREARGEDMVRLIDHLKKPDMAREAERLLDGSGWLPEPLRLRGSDDAEPEEALPAFLEGDAEAEDFAIAAE